MRVIALLLAGGVLASCTTAPNPRTALPTSSKSLRNCSRARSPKSPSACIPHYRADDMRIIDDETIAFRDGARRTYVTHMNGVCSNLEGQSYALVTKKYGTADTCSGDIAHVVDTANGMTVGSCSFGDFTPYVTAGR